MLDERLEGKELKDITIKFVRENLTEDELNEDLMVENHVYKYKTFGLDYNLDLKVALAELCNELLDFTRSGVDIELVDFSQSDIDIEYTEIETKLADTGEKYKHYQKVWKGQIKEINDKKAEYETYLRLKEKYEDG